MIAEEMVDVLTQRFGEGIAGARLQSAHPCVEVVPDVWHDVAEFMKTDGRLRFNLLRCISSVDLPEDGQLVLVYDLLAFERGGATGGSSASVRTSGEGAEALWTRRHEFCVRVTLPRDKPHVASVADVWPTADWHEREAYDMMGIVFDGHPDSVEGPEGPHPRRILCPDDWEGYPLRKDYVFPMEYHGIPAVTEYEQTRPAH